MFSSWGSKDLCLLPFLCDAEETDKEGCTSQRGDSQDYQLLHIALFIKEKLPKGFKYHPSVSLFQNGIFIIFPLNNAVIISVYIIFKFMKFSQPRCKIQMIIKNEKEYRKIHSREIREKEKEQHCQIMWKKTNEKSNVHEDILNIESVINKSPTKKSRVLQMMSKIVTQYKKQTSLNRSMKKSKSPKSNKSPFEIVRSNLMSHSQKDLNNKVKLIKQMKKSNEYLSLKGFKAVQSTHTRPVSAFDLQNRLQPSSRALTARTTKSRPKSIEKGSTSRSIISARKHNKAMSFNPQDYEEDYNKKLKLFLDYLYKVNFSNGLFRQLQLLSVQAPIQRYKIYIGKGNNHQLLKELFRRRFWYEITDNKEEYCHLYWTQFEISELHMIQICKNNKQQPSQGLLSFEQGMKSLVMSKSFNFRDELHHERTLLNCKIMSKYQSEQVQPLIQSTGYIKYDKVFQFVTITNHIPGTKAFTIKKNLVNNLKKYYQDVLDEDPFKIIPKSFHLTEYKGYQIQFFQHLVDQDPKKLWIIKPGENTCRCEGIEIFPAPQVLKRIQQRWQQQEQTCSFVIQSYIENPLLYYERKCDIRHYMLLTCINGTLKAYWYRDGYVRTSSSVYPLVTKMKSRNPLSKKFKNQFNEQLMGWLKKPHIHFTNDVIQIEHQDYGKHQPGNKLSYVDFQKYLDYQHAQYPFFDKILPKMKEIALNVLHSVKGLIDPQRKACNFQLFGLDYIIDEDFNVWLLQINNNPNLVNNSPVLDRVIPGVLEQVIRLCLDPLLPPRNHYPAKQQHNLPQDSLAALKFQLFYQQ